MTKPIEFSNWETVVAELRQFGKIGEVTTRDDWIRIDFGSAHIEVSQDGNVSTGMPLHDFEQKGEFDFVVDHDEGSLTIEADNVTYTFRRPSG